LRPKGTNRLGVEEGKRGQGEEEDELLMKRRESGDTPSRHPSLPPLDPTQRHATRTPSSIPIEDEEAARLLLI
jgi:hypothetical protein